MREIRPQGERFGYPDRVASRRIRDGAIVCGDETSGVVSCLHPQALARLIEMGIDGVLRDSEAPGDLLGAEVLINQPQTFALTRGQYIER